MLLFAVGVVVVILLALGGAALWLFGAQSETPETGQKPVESGIVFVQAIDTYGDRRVTSPVGIGADGESFFVTLRDQAAIVEYDLDGDYLRSWGERGMGEGQLLTPLGVAVDRLAGRIYVTDRSRLRLICYDLAGDLLWEVPVLDPLTPATTTDGVAVSTFGPIALFNVDGEVQGEFGKRGELSGQFDFARGLVVLDETSAIVADTNNARVQRIEFSGEETATVDWVYGRPPLNQDDDTTLFGVPVSVTLDDAGRAYVLDGFRAEVTVLDPATGEEEYRFRFTTGAEPGMVYLPSGIVFLGNDTFAITDTGNNRIEIFRLLLPEENTLVARSPQLLWLAALPLLLFVPLLGQKRWFVTSEALTRAADEGNLRLLAAVLKRIHVLPEVYEQYKDTFESGVHVGAYLRPAKSRPADQSDDAEDLLAKAAHRTLLDRLLLRRHTVLCADDQQCARIAERGLHVRAHEHLVSEYALDGDDAPQS